MFRRYLRMFLLLALASPTATHAQDSVSPVTLPGTELHSLRAAANGIEYRIYVALPWAYATNDTLNYPVLYLLDGDAYFALMTQAHQSQRVVAEVADAIMVGIGYPVNSVDEWRSARTLDMTPTQLPAFEESSSADWGQTVRTGGAAAFLRALTDDIIPFIETRYRTSGERSLAGHSLGGLFGAYVLFHEPQHFGSYLLGSPALAWDEEVAFRYEELFSAQNRALPARVFLSIGSLEGPQRVPRMERMAAILSERSYDGLQLSTFIFEEETHNSVVPATLSRGLRVLLPVDQ